MKQQLFYFMFEFIVLHVITIVFIPEKLFSQVDISYESAKIQKAYKNPASLCFDVKFSYAMEKTPSIIMDSSVGSFKLSGTCYWGTIDSIEFMQNASYSISLYKSEKIMNINNPSNIYPQIVNFSSFDSLVGKNNYTVSYILSGKLKTITLKFSDQTFPYKYFSISYDSVTNFVSQINYAIKEEADENFNNDVQGDNNIDYVIVKADYYNYQIINFSKSFFDAENYFVIQANVYKPHPVCSGYEVFVSSPNLLK